MAIPLRTIPGAITVFGCEDKLLHLDRHMPKIIGSQLLYPHPCRMR